jgi:hypothetical protein
MRVREGRGSGSTWRIGDRKAGAFSMGRIRRPRASAGRLFPQKLYNLQRVRGIERSRVPPRPPPPPVTRKI